MTLFMEIIIMQNVRIKLTNDNINMLNEEMGGVEQGIRKILVYIRDQGKHVRHAIRLTGEEVLIEPNSSAGKIKHDNTNRHSLDSFVKDLLGNEIRLKIKRTSAYVIYSTFCLKNEIKVMMGKNTFYDEMRLINNCEEKRTNGGIYYFIVTSNAGANF